jgi:hypothetical protein
MTSTEQIGAPVRVEKSDPEIVAAVAKAKAADAGEVREVSRLEGLCINEEAARREVEAAAIAFTAARQNYHNAASLYDEAVAARRAEEEARAKA